MKDISQVKEIEETLKKYDKKLEFTRRVYQRLKEEQKDLIYSEDDISVSKYSFIIDLKNKVNELYNDYNKVSSYYLRLLNELEKEGE